jgi:poly-gamma-glutamate synthesis protein (capsule biosynthesis protein)
VNASDHCGCKDKEEWGKSIWIIDHDNLEPVLSRIKNLVRKGKFIVFSIHWGPNYSYSVSNEMQSTGRRLIDAGVGVVFGHSAHHITSPPIELYVHGIIIYGLGDFVNDYAVQDEYESDRALMCLVDLQEHSVKLIPVRRDFVTSGSSVPEIK